MNNFKIIISALIVISTSGLQLFGLLVKNKCYFHATIEIMNSPAMFIPFIILGFMKSWTASGIAILIYMVIGLLINIYAYKFKNEKAQSIIDNFVKSVIDNFVKQKLG